MLMAFPDDLPYGRRSLRTHPAPTGLQRTVSGSRSGGFHPPYDGYDGSDAAAVFATSRSCCCVFHSRNVLNNRVNSASPHSRAAIAKALAVCTAPKPWYSFSMWIGSVSVRPASFPETTLTAPNSPMARALHRSTPYSKPHLMFGTVTRQNICQALAPSVRAASSSSGPSASITGINSRAMNGNVTNVVARMMPGNAKMMSMRVSPNTSGPTKPYAPKISTKIKPAMTGDTENGRSMSEFSTALPGKRNREIDQAAARPNVRLKATAQTAAISVSFKAWIASGCCMASTTTPMPSAKPCVNTFASGPTTITPRNSTANAISGTRTYQGSCRTIFRVGVAAVASINKPSAHQVNLNHRDTEPRRIPNHENTKLRNHQS